MKQLPKRLFFTGVPGSRWSGIAQILEEKLGLNTSDRRPEREYSHGQFSGHRGAYFGAGMEYRAHLSDPDYLDQPWLEPGGTRLIKSHDWAYQLDDVQNFYPEDWTILVYRPDNTSFAWWHQAGGFTISYPDYTHYQDSVGMQAEIGRQNAAILAFASRNSAVWYPFGARFGREVFGVDIQDQDIYRDILITVIENQGQ